VIRTVLWSVSFILFSNCVLAAEPSGATLQARAIREGEVDLTSCKEIGDSNAGLFGKFLWEEQDTIETEILNGIGSINLGTDLVNQNIDTGYGNFKVGFEVAPKRRVYPVNFGSVKDGRPVRDPRVPGQDPKSGYYIVDTYRTALSGNLDTTRLLRNVVQIFNHVTVGDSVEFGLQVRRIRLRRSSKEVTNLMEQNEEDQKKEYKDLNSSPVLDPKKSIIEDKIEEGLGYIFDGISLIYKTAQNIIQTIAKPYTNDQTSQIFFAGLFDGVKLKQELFRISAQTAKTQMVNGDILSMLQYVTYGPTVGVGSGIFTAGLNVHQSYITREVRVTRLEGDKIRLSLIHYNGIGDKLQASMGIGITHLTPAWGRAQWEKFFQTEIRYTLDLGNVKAVAAFNEAARQYKPNWNLLVQYSDDPTHTGVEKDGVSVIGDGLQDVGALIKKGKEDGLKRTARSRTAVTSMEFLVFRRKAMGEKDSYKECRTDFDKSGDAFKTICDFYTLSQKIKTRTINIPKVLKRHDASRVACESFASLDAVDSTKAGVNLHCFYQFDDLFTTQGNYDNYMGAVKTLSGVLEDRLEPLYSDVQWAPVRAKILGDLSASNRALKGTHQALKIDLYMNKAYTDLIFQRPKLQQRVQDTIAEIFVGRNDNGSSATWNQIEARGKTNSDSCHYNENYVDVIGGDRGNNVSCNEVFVRASEMWHTFVKIESTDDIPKRLKILNSYFDSKGRSPYVPLMLLLLGGDYQNQVNIGNLALRFSYGAEDQKADPSKTYDIGSNFDGLSQGYKRIPDLNADPNPGTARVFDVRVCVLPGTLKAGDPKLYLRFNSSLESTIPNVAGVSSAFQLSGFVNKHEMNPVKKDTREASFVVPELEPTVFIKDGQKQYQYIVEFSNLAEANLKTGTNYSAYFDLEDRNIDYGDGEYEHFSELVKLLLNIKL
jgi:hypothetical protein